MHEKRRELFERLQGVFRDVFDDEELEINETTNALDIFEWDSLMHITLVVEVEKEFGIQLNASEIGKLENVGEMLDLLVEKTV